MSYWERYTARRISRRRAVTGVASVTAAAAFLAACGGDDDDSTTGASTGSTSTTTTSSSSSSAATGSTGGRGGTGASGSTGGSAAGLLHTPTDSTSQAKVGGTLKDFSRDEGGSFDALASGDSTTYDLVSNYTYPALVKFSTGVYPDASKNEVLGDLGETWEFSPDRMTITFKLRQGLKWENKAPVSGREIDAEDVVQSWNRYAELSSYASQVAYAPDNASASVVSMEALDSHTVKVNMFRPDPAVLALLGWSRTRVLPREFDGGYDPASQVIGYGPYLLQDYQGSIGFKWARNPDYYVKDRPFIESIERPIVPEYATQLAQFRAGNIYTSVVTPEDLLPTKKDLPETLLVIGSGHIAFNGVHLTFGYEGDSPFGDLRLRQAVNYLIDRQAYEDVLTNRKALSAEGIDIEALLAIWLGPYWEDYYLDPFDEAEFGPTSKYLHYNPDEAKSLMSAAGFPNGLETGFYFPAGRGGYQQQIADIVPVMLTDGGIKANPEGVDNNSVFIPNMLRGYAGGKRPSGPATNGLQVIAGGTRVTADLNLQNSYHPDGPSFIGMPVNGGEPQVGDAEITDLVSKIRQEFDHDRQVEFTHEFHRLMAERAYGLPMHWSTPTLQLVWPVLGNYAYFTQSVGGSREVESALQWWIDESKPPLA